MPVINWKDRVPGDCLQIESLEARVLLAIDVVEDIFPGEGWSNPSDLVNVHGSLFFTAQAPNFGKELWKSGGKKTNTDLVLDIRPGYLSSNPQHLTAVGHTLFFTANARGIGTELWKSDGTTAGTVLVKDVSPGLASSDPEELTDVNGTLFFSAYDPVHGRELWKSDGTADGTQLVRDIAPGDSPYGGGQSSDPSGFTNLNGVAFFRAADWKAEKVNGPRRGKLELWRSDGTTAGTFKIRDNDVSDVPMAVAGGKLFFNASEGGDLYTGPTVGLWVTDGTYRHTTLVAGVYPWYQTQVLVVSKSIYFTTDEELWRSDGTAKGTVIVKQLDANSSHPAGLTSFDGKVFFTVEAGNFGKCALWCSDGTRKGTAVVKQIYFGHPPAQSTFAVLGGTLFFAGSDGLYQSDGTAEGTALVNRLDQESNILSMATVGNMLFLGATEPKVGRELWMLPVRTRSGRAADSAAGVQRSRPAAPSANSFTPFGGTMLLKDDRNSELLG